MRRLSALSLVLLSLAACVSPPPAPRPAPPPPATTPTPTPPPVAPPTPLSADWNDWPFTQGDWRYLKQPGATIGQFGSPGAAQLTLTCDRFAHQLRLTGIAPTPATIRTTSLTRVLAPTDAAGEPALVLAANDPLLDAIAFSRGRFVVEQAGRAPLVLRPFAEIGRVIEDCRG